MIRDTEIRNEILFFEEKLNGVTSDLRKLEKIVPKGASLHAIRHGKGYQYFLRKKGSKTKSEYIKKENRDIAVVLAQLEYDKKLEKLLIESLHNLVKYQASSDPFKTAYEQMTDGKRVLLNLPYISDENYILNWKNKEYRGLNFAENSPEYYTRQGLRVRSKSELIIADILDEISVPFHYEKPLNLNTGVVHPDFTLLSIKERREIYWEHFGMMDDEEYRNKAFLKIRRYESNGLYQSDSLICTFETTKFTLNIRDIRKMILQMKVRLGY